MTAPAGHSGVLTPSLRSRWKSSVTAVVLGISVAALVVYPLLGKGFLLLLDWVHGPNLSLPDAFYGKGGSEASIPMGFVALAIQHVVGPASFSWMAIAFVFPLATWSISRLVPGPIIAKLAAGLLFGVNPFVFERLTSGQSPLSLHPRPI